MGQRIMVFLFPPAAEEDWRGPQADPESVKRQVLEELAKPIGVAVLPAGWHGDFVVWNEPDPAPPTEAAPREPVQH